MCSCQLGGNTHERSSLSLSLSVSLSVSVGVSVCVSVSVSVGITCDRSGAFGVVACRHMDR